MESMWGDHGISMESVCEEIMGFQWRAFVRSWDFNGERMWGDHGISMESVCEIMEFQLRAYVRRSWNFN
jgi:hypothetical protein